MIFSTMLHAGSTLQDKQNRVCVILSFFFFTVPIEFLCKATSCQLYNICYNLERKTA